MLTLYLACLAFGGVLLTISLFAGGDADADVDHSLDMHADADFDHSLDVHAEVDVDHSLDVHADVDVDHSLDVHADAGDGNFPAEVELDADHPAVASVNNAASVGHSSSALSAAFEFFSFRNLVYMTTFFGLTGSVLTWLAMGFGLTLSSSIGMGLFAGVVGHRFMKYLRGSESGQALHIGELIGHAGTVVIPPTKVRRGKIRITRSGQVVELLALLHESSEADELRPGDQVFVLTLEKDVVLVDKADFLDNS
jgi:hypothetical protein